MQSTKVPKTVSAYIAAAAPQARPMLRQLRKLITSCAPKAVEGLSYHMPYYSYKGRLVYFAAFRDHCSLFPASGSVTKNFAKELTKYKTSKGTIQFPLGKAIPAGLVKKIVKARMQENEIRNTFRTVKV
ncbi:MAG: DUF1801 domain-containing protein [Patescibacteria group bacterium]|jgi:uncharacterized protein YdhG (YjbR/CyaY superfamily)